MTLSVTVATDIILYSAYDRNETQESDKEQWLCNPNPGCMVYGFGQSCPMSALPWIFGYDTKVTAEKFSNVEDQAETCALAKQLGQEIAQKLGVQMRM
jgi:hypothetical protein